MSRKTTPRGGSLKLLAKGVSHRRKMASRPPTAK